MTLTVAQNYKARSSPLPEPHQQLPQLQTDQLRLTAMAPHRIRSHILKALVPVARTEIWCLLSTLRTEALICLNYFTGLFTFQEIKCAIFKIPREIKEMI